MTLIIPADHSYKALGKLNGRMSITGHIAADADARVSDGAGCGAYVDVIADAYISAADIAAGIVASAVVIAVGCVCKY